MQSSNSREKYFRSIVYVKFEEYTWSEFQTNDLENVMCNVKVNWLQKAQGTFKYKKDK